MRSQTKNIKPKVSQKVSKRQNELLEFFSSRKFMEQELKDIQQMIAQYYRHIAQTDIDDFVKKQGWSQQDLDRMAQEHIRTPYHK